MTSWTVYSEHKEIILSSKKYGFFFFLAMEFIVKGYEECFKFICGLLVQYVFWVYSNGGF